MSDIWVNCSHCGQVFSTPDELVGQSIACPQCGKQVAVFASGIRSEGASKFQVKHDNTITGDKRCPYCEATMAAEAIICIRCGYNTRTGLRYLDNSSKVAHASMDPLGIWPDHSGRTGENVFVSKPDRRRPGSRHAPRATGSRCGGFGGCRHDERDRVTNMAVATNETAATNKTAVIQPVTGVQTALPPVVASVNKSPVDIAKIEVDYRAALNHQLVATYPLYAPGDAVVLRRGNGMIHRGTLAGLKPDAVVVVKSGQTNEIPLKVLDRASRLKCDPAFRAAGGGFPRSEAGERVSRFLTGFFLFFFSTNPRRLGISKIKPYGFRNL